MRDAPRVGHQRCRHRGQISRPLMVLHKLRQPRDPSLNCCYGAQETSHPNTQKKMVRCTNQTHKAFFVVGRCAPGGTARGVATEARSPDPFRPFTKLIKPREATPHLLRLSSLSELPYTQKETIIHSSRRNSIPSPSWTNNRANRIHRPILPWPSPGHHLEW